MKKWYSVRCIFRHPTREKKECYFLYEERILLWEVSDIDTAIKMAEVEAKQYEIKEDCVYLGLAQAYHTFIDEPKSGVEVFSLMRDDDSPPEDYIDFYFDTGEEKQTHYKNN